MPRPKTGKPVKRSLNLTVSEEARENLNFLSNHYGESISALVSAWAGKEAAELRNANDGESADGGK